VFNAAFGAGGGTGDAKDPDVRVERVARDSVDVRVALRDDPRRKP
jgi:hypothetical protein